MTTDLKPKETAVRARLGGRLVTVGGMAKGSGMIHPNMATMLAYVTTDAVIEQPLLQLALRRAVNQSFNCITVEGTPARTTPSCAWPTAWQAIARSCATPKTLTPSAP